MQKLIFTIFLFFNTAFLYGQALINFNVQLIKDSVRIEFVIRGGFTCTGVRIDRSTDSINFINIYQFAGVCGGTSSDVKYVYTDNNPVVNKTNYYRLDLRAEGLSNIVGVFYRYLGNNDFLIITNPCISNCTLYYYNDEKRKLVVNIFDAAGKKVIDFTTQESTIDFSQFVFSNGVYFFTLTNSNKIIDKGKIVVL